MIFDGIVELFRNKKIEAPAAPQLNLEELKQHEANLNTVITQGEKDFAHPADANRIKELRNRIAEIKSRETVTAQPEVPAGLQEAPTQVQTPEEPKAA